MEPPRKIHASLATHQLPGWSSPSHSATVYSLYENLALHWESMESKVFLEWTVFTKLSMLKYIHIKHAKPKPQDWNFPCLYQISHYVSRVKSGKNMETCDKNLEFSLVFTKMYTT